MVGPLEVTKALLPQLRAKAAGDRKIVFVSSSAGDIKSMSRMIDQGWPGVPLDRMMTYMATKAALNMIAVVGVP